MSAYLRPPAPPAKPQRALRLGVIQSGKIVEERLLRRRETITIGQAPGCTVMTPDPRFASKEALLEANGDRWVLRVDDRMTGRIAGAAGGPIDLATLRKNGGGAPVREVPIGDDTRGKVTVGDVTVLFQFVDLPPVAPPPVLPAALRGGLFAELDWTYAAILFVLATAMAPTLWYLQRVPIPKTIELADLSSAVAKYIIHPPKSIADFLKGTDTSEPGTSAPDDPATATPDDTVADATGATKPGPMSAEDRARKAAEDRARILGGVKSKGLLAPIGAAVAGGKGALADVLGGSSWTGDVDDAFAHMSDGVTVSTDTAGGVTGRDGMDVGDGTVADLAAGDGVVTGVGPVGPVGSKGPERDPTGTVVAKGPIDPPPGSPLSPEEIAKVVSRRLGAITTCYEREMKSAGKLEGKMLMRWTINGTGRVTGVSVIENGLGSARLAACMIDRIGGWRFPEPEGGAEMTVQYPFVFTASGS